MQPGFIRVSTKVAALIVLSLISSTASASKARLNSLQGAIGLYDTQTIFAQPAYIHKLNPYVTYEFGSTAVAGSPKAEGGFLLAREGSRWGAYLGHQSPYQNDLRAVGTYQRQDNPIDIFFGKNNWATSVSISSSEDENASAKQTTLIGKFGLINDHDGGQDEFYGTLELLANAEKPNNTYRGAPIVNLGYLRRSGEMTYAADVAYGDGSHDNAGAKKLKYTSVAGAINHRPIAELYYGVAFAYQTLEQEGQKREVFGLPFSIGLEKDMFSWMTVRGSVRQNILLGSNKSEIAGTKAEKNLNNTSVAMGLGFKHDGFVFDGTMAAGTSGDFNATTFLTTASMTYSF